MLKKISALLASCLLSFASLLVLAPAIAHAATDVCTWTGATNDNFNTATNWSCVTDGAAVPDNGDSLVFDNTGLSAQKALNNDISSASFNDITFSGTAFHSFTISGNAITLTGDITNTSSDYPEVLLDITLGADVTFASTSSGYNGLTIGLDSNTLDLGAHTLTLNSALKNSVYVVSTISGSGGIVKSGTGIAYLYGANTYAGSTLINAGLLNAGSLTALGTVAGGTTVASGAALAIAVSSSEKTGTVNEPLTINSATRTDSDSGTTVGALLVYAGCGQSSCLGTSIKLAGAITLGADVKVSSYTDTIVTLTGALSGQHTISLLGGSGGTLIINSSANTSQTENGTSQAPVETITVDANDKNTTTVYAGPNQTYIIDGQRGDTSVSSGGVLKGTGTVGILHVYAGGTVAPGHSPGCLSSGNLFVSGTYQAELGGAGACDGYDQLKVTGTVDVTSGTLSVLLYNGFKPAKGQSYTIIDNDGTADAVTGTFAGLAEGATVTSGGYSFRITYVGGDGNDVVLSVIGTPDTGFQILTTHPLITLITTTLLALGIAVIARRYSKALAR